MLARCQPARQRHGESGAARLRGLDLHVTAVRARDLARDVEPEAQPLAGARVRASAGARRRPRGGARNGSKRTGRTSTSTEPAFCTERRTSSVASPSRHTSHRLPGKPVANGISQQARQQLGEAVRIPLAERVATLLELEARVGLRARDFCDDGAAHLGQVALAALQRQRRAPAGRGRSRAAARSASACGASRTARALPRAGRAGRPTCAGSPPPRAPPRRAASAGRARGCEPRSRRAPRRARAPRPPRRLALAAVRVINGRTSARASSSQAASVPGASGACTSGHVRGGDEREQSLGRAPPAPHAPATAPARPGPATRRPAREPRRPLPGRAHPLRRTAPTPSRVPARAEAGSGQRPTAQPDSTARPVSRAAPAGATSRSRGEPASGAGSRLAASRTVGLWLGGRASGGDSAGVRAWTRVERD